MVKYKRKIGCCLLELQKEKLEHLSTQKRRTFSKVCRKCLRTGHSKVDGCSSLSKTISDHAFIEARVRGLNWSLPQQTLFTLSQNIGVADGGRRRLRMLHRNVYNNIMTQRLTTLVSKLACSTKVLAPKCACLVWRYIYHYPLYSYSQRCSMILMEKDLLRPDT